MSRCRKNSARDKVMGKKWIYLERYTLHRRVWPISEGERPQNMEWLVFMGWVISQATEWEGYSNYFGEGVEISRNWATALFWPFYSWPRSCHGTDRCVS